MGSRVDSFLSLLDLSAICLLLSLGRHDVRVAFASRRSENGSANACHLRLLSYISYIGGLVQLISQHFSWCLPLELSHGI